MSKYSVSPVGGFVIYSNLFDACWWNGFNVWRIQHWRWNIILQKLLSNTAILIVVYLLWKLNMWHLTGCMGKMILGAESEKGIKFIISRNIWEASQKLFFLKFELMFQVPRPPRAVLGTWHWRICSNYLNFGNTNIQVLFI